MQTKLVAGTRIKLNKGVIPTKNFCKKFRIQHQQKKTKIVDIHKAGPSKNYSGDNEDVPVIISSSSWSPSEMSTSSNDEWLSEENKLMAERQRETTYYMIERTTRGFI